MSMRTMTFAQWEKHCVTHYGDPSQCGGVSPGGVAAELELSRQAIHKAMDRGDLDGWRVVRSALDRTTLMILITEASISRYRKLLGYRGRAKVA